MQKFSTSNMKFIGLIIAVCFIFAIVVRHAYDYLPKSTNTDKGEFTNPTVVNIQLPSNYEEEEDSTDEYNDEIIETEQNVYDNEEEEEKEEEKEIAQHKQKPKLVVVPELEPLESISSEKQKTVSNEVISESSFEYKFLAAMKLKRNRDLASAITSFESALSYATSASEKADCYEQIAECNAIQKRYGSAIINAQKAYNLTKKSSTEVLLARLYYKTGEIEKATNKINYVLKKDFTVEE